MMAEVGLLDDRTAAVAVRTPDFASRDLRSEDSESGLPAGQLNNTGSLGPYMIEIQDDWVRLPAGDAGSLREVVEEEEKVAAP
jgi:hypothetical protein